MRLLFDVAVLLGAFLLFFVQPLIAKRLLPWFGGGPAVWSACLMFFQAALVAGYGYAHVARRLGIRRQVALHAVLLGLAMLSLPIVPPESLKPVDGADPVWRLLAILTRTVGPSFVLLAATAPLLQDWFAASRRDKSPYGLYVISNVGALAALLSYPTLVEPSLAVDVQSRWWSFGFAAFAVLAALCGWRAARLSAANAAIASPAAVDTAAAPSTMDRALWPVLPAAGTAVLVATTNQLSQDVAALPLIWIAPLALYLLTYIAGFAGWYRRTIVGAVMIVAIAVALYAIETQHGWSLRVQVTWLLAALTAACLFCHGELAHVKPSPRFLTAFYFQISIGGAIGGIFVSIGAPLLFDRFVELPLILLGVVALFAVVVVRELPAAAPRWARGAAIGLAVVPVALAAYVAADRDRWSYETYRHRNFYGVLRVREEPASTPQAMRMLYHGRVMHGGQFLDPAHHLSPATYYGRGNGIAAAIAGHPHRLAGRPLAVGAIGLGTGTLAGWGQPGDRFRFYEIDPAVVEVARTQFSFLAESAAAVDVVLGDARLTIERELRDPARRHAYDVLAVDAFSGDAIPVHLLTRESFALYREALAPDGIIAVHVSNRYLDLKPVVYGLADDAKLTVIPFALAAVAATRAPGSTWLLLTTNEEFIEGTPGLPEIGPRDPRRIVWTDDFSSLISVLR